MRHGMILAALAMVAAGTVFAQGDVIAQRKQAMKSAADATSQPLKMLKGEAPFDLAKVQDSLKVVADVAQKLPNLYPDTAKTGGDTHALPVIWENKADFVALYDKLGKDASAALGSIKDEASFKAAYPTVLRDCGNCHKTYRAPL